jgi:hypothetical protein
VHFSPHSAEPRPCWHCSHYIGMTAAGTAAVCSLSNGPRVRSMPAQGCSAFVREPGADDEPEKVPVFVAVDAMPAGAARGGRAQR